jgi:hypothetical protein
MLPKDNFYDLILTHRLPVSRGNMTVRKYLENYFANYIKAYKNALHRTVDCALRPECYALLNDQVSVLEELCDDILKIFDYYDAANMSVLYHHFSEMMNKIEPFLMTKNIGTVGYESYRSYYRIRAGEKAYTRKDLFHIPLEKRQLIKSYRYSIPGYPCLYLSSGLEMCWFECGMPKEFSYAAFKLEADDACKVKLIDFSMTPVDLVSSIHINYLNHPEDSGLIDKYIANYLVHFPLRAACSLEVANRDVSFIEEYMFPQQLLLWVRENDCYDGIVYRTSSAIEKAREWNYINLVMPAKDIEGGYCKHLNNLFTITEPVKVEIRSIIYEHHKQINKVRGFLLCIESKYFHGYTLYPYREIISLCKTFLHLCDMLISDNYKNAESIYQTMDTLNLFSYLLCDNEISIKQKALKDGKQLFDDVDENILSNEFDETMHAFKEDVKPVLIKFWSYSIRISADSTVDYTTYRHAL